MVIHIRLPEILVTTVFAGLLLITLSASPFAANPFRIQVGLGAHGGDPDIEFAGESGSLDTDIGIAISAGVWVDEVGWKHLSLGLEYLRLQDSDFSESSAAFLGGPLRGTLDIEPTIDAVMVNAAIRNNNGSIHPYFGGGIGVGRADVDLTASPSVTLRVIEFLKSFGLTNRSANDTDTVFAGQLFAGVDADVGGNWYLGVNGRYFLMDADLSGADVEFRTWSVMGIVGFRF